MSLSTRREWVEIYKSGKKFVGTESLSTRREWVEIIAFTTNRPVDLSLSTRREWVEIKVPYGIYHVPWGLSPHGESGLK